MADAAQVIAATATVNLGGRPVSIGIGTQGSVDPTPSNVVGGTITGISTMFPGDPVTIETTVEFSDVTADFQTGVGVYRGPSVALGTLVASVFYVPVADAGVSEAPLTLVCTDRPGLVVDQSYVVVVHSGA